MHQKILKTEAFDFEYNYILLLVYAGLVRIGLVIALTMLKKYH
jgi:hypothetical protein